MITRATALARLVALGLAASLAAACGSSPGTAPRPTPVPSRTGPPAPSTPPAAASCLKGARRLPTITESVGALRPVAVGSGTNVVILSEQSNLDLCGWLPLVPKLTAAGYEVVLWDYGTGAPQDELRAVIAVVRGTGTRHVALVGASEGAKTSLIVAASPGIDVRGVVSLSAESILVPAIQVSDYVAKLTVPVLFVTASGDEYGAADAGPEFDRVARSKDKRLLTVPGKDHGVDLLTGKQAAKVTTAMLDFLRRVMGSTSSAG